MGTPGKGKGEYNPEIKIVWLNEDYFVMAWIVILNLGILLISQNLRQNQATVANHALARLKL